MGHPGLSEKRGSLKSGASSSSWSKTPGCVAIVASQHLLLWSALYVAASTLYILGVEAVMPRDIPSVVLLPVASIVSQFYLSLSNTTTHLRKNARNRMQSERVDTLKSLATRTLEGLTFIWAVTVMLSLVFTTARQPMPLCSSAPTDPTASTSPLDRGTTCIVNRVGLLMSWIALIACGCLFVLLHKVNDPFRCSLFGLVREDDLLPLFLPYRASHDQRIFSNMSFNCRSSTSLSSNTVAAAWTESTSNLLPSDDIRKPHGLGIYGTNRSTPSLLRPRPSLSSIRSHATMSLPPPPTSPLPPLPAYFPAKYRTQSAMHRAVHPPRAYDLRPKANSTADVRVVPPSPVLMTSDNLAVLNRSNNESSHSLSSIYSRSISGETPRPLLSTSSRSSSSTSTVTLKRSPLREQMILTEDMDSDIDDVADLERRMRVTKNSEQEGLVQRQRVASGLSARFSLKPLEIKKERVGYAF